MIQLINVNPKDKEYTYDERIALLRERKVNQTIEKAQAGGEDGDDYGFIVQDIFNYKLKPNHPNGSIYGFEVKANGRVPGESFSGLSALRKFAGRRFRAGIVFYTGERAFQFEERLFALPASKLWEAQVQSS